MIIKHNTQWQLIFVHWPKTLWHLTEPSLLLSSALISSNSVNNQVHSTGTAQSTFNLMINLTFRNAIITSVSKGRATQLHWTCALIWRKQWKAIKDMSLGQMGADVQPLTAGCQRPWWIYPAHPHWALPSTPLVFSLSWEIDIRLSRNSIDPCGINIWLITS